MTGLDFPIALRVGGRRVLLVGAGKIATQRLGQLIEAGALVYVVAPLPSAEVLKLATEGAVTYAPRAWEPADCDGAFVIFSAIDDRDASHAIAAEARRRGILINAADIPELCDFHVPAFGRRGPVTVAVSTGGLAPGLSRALRDKALDAVGPEWGKLAKLLGRLRKLTPAGPARTAALSSVIHSDAAQLIAAGDRARLFARIRETFR